MVSNLLIAALSSFAVVQAASNVVAVFLIGREGDRTSEVQGNTQLTTLGKNQVFNTASYFRSRYLNSSSPDFIENVDIDYLYNQIYAAAPNENVLGNTAAAFLQGFYPPSGPATTATLTNGSAQFNPLDGYQYVLVNGMPSTAPDTIWIKGDMYCPAMTNASITYYQSTEFLSRQSDLQSFYDKFAPLLEGIFPKREIGFQSAYGIFDYLNVGFVHNHTIFANLSTDDLFQLRTLADEQELALVYNVSSPNTSIGGKTLSGAILSQLNKTVTQTDKNLKITYFAASYSVFQAFFGLSGLLDADADFYGLPDYGSIMSFELRRPVNSADSNELFVRYGFRNGSLASAELNTFPLFLRTQIEADIPWSQFVAGMLEQSISNQADWCHACVNSNLTFCAAYTNSIPTRGSGSNVSPVGAAFIGAGITISIVASIEALVAVWWFTRKRRNSMVVAEKEGMSETASQKSMLA